MKVSIFLCVSIALLYSVVFGDHDGHAHDDHDHGDHNHGDHNHSDHGHHHHHHHHHHHPHHHHPHGKGKHHHRHHHHSNESMACHKLAPANAAFAFSLYKHIALGQTTGNIFFSPVSISTILAMISLGAKSVTSDQILKGLGFNISEIPEQDIHTGFQHLLHMLNDPDSELQLSSGNALFIDKELKLLQKFIDDVKSFYEADAFSTDFQNSEAATTQINDYVGKETNGKIVDLLSSVDPQTVLVLINYIYFRGKWDKPFEEEQTREEDFNVDENTVVKVPMMHRTGMYNVAYDGELACVVVEIPYKGNASALFILPDQGKMKQVEEGFQKL
ncbi:hypothetical protein FKM82_026594, partial [Ascaphus truei]